VWEEETEPTPTKPGRRQEPRGALGRKCGINLLMLYQLIQDVRSLWWPRCDEQWFESGVLDLVLGDQRSRDSGLYVEALRRPDRGGRSAQPFFANVGFVADTIEATRPPPAIMPHEVLRMRTDEEMIFTTGNPPLRCGRAVWLRHRHTGENRFHRKEGSGT
jgi:type IV secretion system protein VirD4